MNKRDIDNEAEREGVALRKQGRYKQSRYHWIRLQEEYKQSISRKAFRG